MNESPWTSLVNESLRASTIATSRAYSSFLLRSGNRTITYHKQITATRTSARSTVYGRLYPGTITHKESGLPRGVRSPARSMVAREEYRLPSAEYLVYTRNYRPLPRHHLLWSTHGGISGPHPASRRATVYALLLMNSSTAPPDYSRATRDWLWRMRRALDRMYR